MGKILLHGAVEFWGGCSISATGTLEFGNNVILAEQCTIKCYGHIKFEDNISVGYKTKIIDAEEQEGMQILPQDIGNITIGEGSWVSSNCLIRKGAHIAPRSIISANSMVDSDLSADPPYQVYAGFPVRVIKTNRRRIVNRLEEKRLTKYFETHPTEVSLTLNVENMDILCLSHFMPERTKRKR